MNNHTQVRNILYDYFQDEVSPEERRIVDEHLATCRMCAEEAREVRAFIVLTGKLQKPSEERPPEFWEQFTHNVERRISTAKERQPLAATLVWNTAVSFFIMRWRYVAAIGGVALASLLVVVLLRWNAPTNDKQPADNEENTQQLVTTVSANPRVSQYFRRSKILFVGLTNMKLGDDQYADLSTERKVSRELVHEARYLKTQPIDERSAQLISDLEKILIELANMKEENGIPNVEIIRGGIHKENLLFKIRMAESLYDSASSTNTQHTY
ncbi:MAG: zf-HC2 domain-containing protein [Ignavibacteriae bacterium]|nr:zf-HC2 domain-containing protein [Ignavibacteria bacterium]MBI3364051.1 zf-HC2 domain-containing protein [Ignavibacteriota bacterium]